MHVVKNFFSLIIISFYIFQLHLLTSNHQQLWHSEKFNLGALLLRRSCNCYSTDTHLHYMKVIRILPIHKLISLDYTFIIQSQTHHFHIYFCFVYQENVLITQDS